MLVGLMRIPLLCLPMLAASCAVLSGEKPAPANNFCLIDKPIGIVAEDSEQTKQRIVEHDRRLYCLCPDIYPEKAEQMDCPDQPEGT